MSSAQRNIALIGFTATPTGRTLQKFGHLDQHGHYVPFDLYCMRQAIDEGFILDVTSNYTTFDTYYKVVKTIEDDPELESVAAKRKLGRLIATDEGGIRQKLEVMIDHFIENVAGNLKGEAKCMIVTSGREEAARYFLSYRKLRNNNLTKYGKFQALVAFTDKVDLDGKYWTEAGLNGFSDDHTAEYFDTSDYQILIVADKYQTGFDQPKLCSMYVDKSLKGVIAVQTLSRLNRIAYDKQIFVLDFVNSFEDIQKAFAPYYETTMLTKPMTLSIVRETHRRLAELSVLDIDDVEEFNRLLATDKLSHQAKSRMWALLDEAARQVEQLGEEGADEARRVIRNFLKQYAFLLQVSPFEDKPMHMDYNFCNSLIKTIDEGHGGGGVQFDLTNKVSIQDFEVKKGSTHRRQKLSSEPEVEIAFGTGTGLTETEFEKLSEIIKDWNARFGTNFDANVAAGSLVSLKANLKKDPRVQQSAKVNSLRGFRHTVEDQTNDALVEGYAQNTEWHKFLLNNEDACRQLINAFSESIYRSLRQDWE